MPKSRPQDRALSPYWLLAVLVTAVFVAEFLIMLLLATLRTPIPSALLYCVLDAALLAAAIAPVLWFVAARPIRQHVTDLRRAQAALLQAHQDLEARVQERTSALEAARAALEAEVADRKRAQDELRLLDTAVNAAANAVMLTDRDGRFIWANPAFTALTGYTPEEVVGQNPRILRSGEHDQAFYEEMWATIRSGRVWRGEVVNRRKSGDLYTEEMTITPVRHEQGEIGHYIAIKQDITERRLSAERFRAVVDTAHDAILSMDSHGTIVAWNRAASTMFGYLADEAVGQPVSLLMPERFRDQHHSGVERALLEGWTHVSRDPREVVGLRKDGTEFPAELSLACWTSHQDVFFTGILRDITERKRAEQALREAAQYWQATFDAIGDGITILDTQQRMVRCNRAWMELLGKPAQEILFRRCCEVVHGTAEPVPACPFGRMMQTGRRETLVLPWGDRWIEVSVDPLRDGEGALVGGVHIVSDITEHRQAAEALTRQAAIIEAMPHLVAVVDASAEGRLLTLNAAGRALLGVGEGERIAPLALADLYPESAHSSLRDEQIPTAVREGMWAGETILISSQGREIQVAQVIVAHRDARGAVEFLSVIARDIRERLRLENELRQSQKMDAIGRLAGGVAHDFNNALLPIMTYGQLLLDRLPVGTPLSRFAVQIVENAERAASLPRQLLAFSHRQVLQPGILNLNTIVSSMEKMLRRILGEDIVLRTLLGPETPNTKADRGQIEQVLMNLVINARDAMPQGGQLTIETTRAELDEAYASRHPGAVAGVYALLRVSDTGCGMDQETLSRVFEPFFTTKGQGKGTGLGLPTVYGIVAQSGGHVRVRSEPGRGATFKVYLPHTEDVPEAEEDGKDEAVPPEATETILVVEDDEAVRQGLAEVLTLHGYVPLQAGSADEALALSRDHLGPIHLALTDVVMPGMSGLRLAEHLIRSRPEMKVLFMSGYTEENIMLHGAADPGDRLLRKPFTPGDLVRSVRGVLDADGSPV